MPSVKVVQREPADGSAPFSESQLLGGRVWRLESSKTHWGSILISIFYPWHLAARFTADDRDLSSCRATSNSVGIRTFPTLISRFPSSANAIHQQGVNYTHKAASKWVSCPFVLKALPS